jgi:hypothetical protein
LDRTGICSSSSLAIRYFAFAPRVLFLRLQAGHHEPRLILSGVAFHLWPESHFHSSFVLAFIYFFDVHLPPFFAASSCICFMVFPLPAHVGHQLRLRISLAEAIHLCPCAHSHLSFSDEFLYVCDKRKCSVSRALRTPCASQY